MSTRVLVIDDEANQKVRRVLDYALKSENWYRPGKDLRVPGNDNHFVAHLNAYRCVFTITEHPTAVVRHLTISISSSENLPGIFAAFTIAEMFGFTGWDGRSATIPEGWMAAVSHSEHCVVIVQLYETGVTAA